MRRRVQCGPDLCPAHPLGRSQALPQTSGFPRSIVWHVQSGDDIISTMALPSIEMCWMSRTGLWLGSLQCAKVIKLCSQESVPSVWLHSHVSWTLGAPEKKQSNRHVKMMLLMHDFAVHPTLTFSAQTVIVQGCSPLFLLCTERASSASDAHY